MKEFYQKGCLPPYLQGPEAETNKGLLGRTHVPQFHKINKDTPDQADAAAGSMLKRVSSLSILRSSTKKEQEELIETNSIIPGDKTTSLPPSPPVISPSWRLQERLRTSGVGLIMSLNVGTDPPDVTKPHPCARLQCWMDPLSMSRAKAKEAIGERLQEQYARWQPQRTAVPVKYRRALDPTVEDVRAVCTWLRKQARSERVLLHYNGHGVPRPTQNGEIWVFDKGHTQYIPLCVADLRQWMGKPSIVILDCSSAGGLVPFLTAPLEEESTSRNPPTLNPDSTMETTAAQIVRDTIVLCATSDQEWLPMYPEYPADIFTSCLTTPIEMALRYFIRRNPQSMGNISAQVVDAIPGKPNDRKTPLGELHWIFAAVTDCIAWNVLPKPLFQRLFRQDHLVAGIFRNFLLADRILRSLNCTPHSYPPLPPGVNNHPLWEAWDLACETCLSALIQDGILGNHLLAREKVSSTPEEEETTEAPPPPQIKPGPIIMGSASSVSSPFFSEQLTAFEIWLEFATIHKVSPSSFDGKDPYESPEQLPIVLQVLLSPAHRVRALKLLRRFLNLGPWAVNVALVLGILPYVLKLLQSPEYKRDLVGIWAKILSFDISCQSDLARDGVLPHFLKHLTWGLDNTTGGAPGALDAEDAAMQRTMAAFILAATCLDHPHGQNECMRHNLHGIFSALFSSIEFSAEAELDPEFEAKLEMARQRLPSPFRMWLCLCIGNLVKGNTGIQKESYKSGVHLRLFARVEDRSSDVRSAAVYALGCLISSSTEPLKTDPPIQTMKQTPSSSQPIVAFPGSAGVLQPGMIPNRLVGISHNSQVPTTTILPGGVPGRLQPTFPAGSNQGSNVQWRSQPSAPGLVAPGTQVPMQPMAGFPGVGMVRPTFGGRSALENPASIGPSPLSLSTNTSPPTAPSVFDDFGRITFDMSVVDVLVKASNDASPVVRYEVITSLALAVEKYLPAFLSLAAKGTVQTEEGKETVDPETKGKVQPSPDLDDETAGKLSNTWKAMRELQHNDPHPAVAAAANAVVSFVHEHLLSIEKEHFGVKETDGGKQRASSTVEANSDRVKRTTSALQMGQASSDNSKSHGSPLPQEMQEDGGHNPLRRISSEYYVPKNGARASTSKLSRVSAKQPSKMEYDLPTSKLYEWKKDLSWEDTFNTPNALLDDPLSIEGAALTYRKQRNRIARQARDKLANHFEKLAPEPPRPKRQRYELFEHDEDGEADKRNEALSERKKELELIQTGMLRAKGSETSTLLRFHPYEDALVACDIYDGISVWNCDKKKERQLLCRNGNPKGTRMTSAKWINEMSNSLFVVGCNDGSVRVWGEFLEPNGRINQSTPSLASAFFAVPDMVVDSSLSGLVLEWQQQSGRLIAGGNSNSIRCWDLETEKCSTVIATKSKACVTSLSTIWQNEPVAGGSLQNHVLGPDVVVAGQSDGLIKLFDMRSSRPMIRQGGRGTKLSSTLSTSGFSGVYDEHSTWVNGAFCTSYGGRHEIVSGSVDGVIKVWDLRVSASLRTYNVQRSPMTALSVHPCIPMLATGSHLQFIKLMTLDGDKLQVITDHERHRIGPVSSLEFHPHKPLLAAGGTDAIVSIYSPKHASLF